MLDPTYPWIRGVAREEMVKQHEDFSLGVRLSERERERERERGGIERMKRRRKKEQTKRETA